MFTKSSQHYCWLKQIGLKPRNVVFFYRGKILMDTCYPRSLCQTPTDANPTVFLPASIFEAATMMVPRCRFLPTMRHRYYPNHTSPKSTSTSRYVDWTKVQWTNLRKYGYLGKPDRLCPNTLQEQRIHKFRNSVHFISPSSSITKICFMKRVLIED